MPETPPPMLIIGETMDQKAREAIALNKEGKYGYAKRKQEKRKAGRKSKKEMEHDSEAIMNAAIHAIRVARGTSVPAHVPKMSEPALSGREFETGNKGGTIKWTPTGVKVKSSGRKASTGRSLNDQRMRGSLNVGIEIREMQINDIEESVDRDKRGY